MLRLFRKRYNVVWAMIISCSLSANGCLFALQYLHGPARTWLYAAMLILWVGCVYAGVTLAEKADKHYGTSGDSELKASVTRYLNGLTRQ